MAVDPPELPGGWLPPQAPDRGAPRPEGYAPPVAPPREDSPQRRPLPVFTTERQPRNGPAIIATFCASTSMALLVFSLGLSFFFSLPLGIAGWVLAAKSDPELNPGQRKTGQILSIIAVGLSIGAMIIWLLLIAAGISPEELQRNLEEELDRQRRSS